MPGIQSVHNGHSLRQNLHLPKKVITGLYQFFSLKNMRMASSRFFTENKKTINARTLRNAFRVFFITNIFYELFFDPKLISAPKTKDDTAV